MSYYRPIVVASGIILFVFDRWLKQLAIHGVTVQWPVGQFILFKNFGIIFSWPVPGGLALMLMLAGLVFVSWLFVNAWRGSDPRKLWAVSLLLTGAISNIYDRVTYHYIIDWAYLGRWWPVFNVADALIMLGLTLYLINREKGMALPGGPSLAA